MQRLLYIYAIIICLIFSNNIISQKNYNSLCWVVTKEGIKDTSYLYGTFHTQDSRVFNFKEGVVESFNKADMYAMELNLDSLNKGNLIKEMIMDSSLSLTKILSEEDYKMVDNFFKDSLKMPLFMFNKMLPFFTAQMVATKGLNRDKENALDIYWFKKAKKQNKDVIGLETMQEQINTFKSIPIKQQAEELVNSVKNYGNEDEINIDDFINIYVSENLDSLLTIINKTNSIIGSESFNYEFLYKRNVIMVNRLEKHLHKGSVFTAIGAAHLPGKKGVIELLRDRGYVVNPLNN